MNPKQQQQIEALLGPNSFRLTPATFAHKVSEGYWQPAKHLMYISALIAQKIHNGGARIIISMAPRHGKSELLSRWTPVWFFDNYPDREIILCSYSADLAVEFGGQVRDIISKDHAPEGANILRCRLDPKHTRVAGFKTTLGGGMRSAGVGGTVYGRGADLLLVDDYFKNPEEAESQAARDKLFSWFSTVGMSRLHENASAIIIATRWNDDDLSGRLLKLKNSPWEEIKLAVQIDDEEMAAKDPLGRQIGDVLWPELRDHGHIAELKGIMSNYYYRAVMQQDPQPPGLGRFKREWVHIIDEDKLPNVDHLHIVRSWDLAGTEDAGDHTVGIKFAKDLRTKHIYIMDVQRFQKSPGAVEKHIERTAILDGNSVKILIEQEPGSAGIAVTASYVALLGKQHFSVEGIRPTGPKIVRIDPFFAAAEHGRVKMVEAKWNDDLLDEYALMTEDAVNDDQVDATSMAHNYLFQSRARAGTFGRKKGGLNSVAYIEDRIGKPANRSAAVAKSGVLVSGVTWGRRRA